jgi:long-chain acyl-CoA synthetase
MERIFMLADIYKKNFTPHKPAMIYKDQIITYAKLDEMIGKYATHYRDMGISKGTKVIINSINCPEYVFAYFAGAKIGAVSIPVNTMLTLEELQYIADNSDSEYILIHPTILKKLELTKEKLGKALALKVMVIDDDFRNAIDTKEPFTDKVDLTENDLSAFLYTSGTTGKQKAVMLSHHNQDINSQHLCQFVGMKGDDNTLCVLPMFHVFALTAIIMASFQLGATFTITEAFKPKEVMSMLKNNGITMFMGVPAMYNVLLSMIKPEDEFPHLRRIICGAASMPQEVFKKATDIFCPDLIEGYGLTEATAALAFNPPDGERKIGSVGVTVPGIECKIVDDSGNELPIGEVGNLVARGENIMQGYYNNPVETAKAIKDGWLYTGDIAKTDADGYFYIVDRKKDIIIVSGLNVYPREIEEVIYTNPIVKEAAVVGADDKLRGECVVAYIVLQDGEDCNARDFIRFLKTRLASYKVPRNINFVDELPKNGSGKILKRMLVTLN